MTQIHILDHQTDEILDTLDNEGTNPFYNDNHRETLKNEETFSFTAPKEIRAAQYLNKRNRVIIPVGNGFFREFIIHYNDIINDVVEVRSLASYIELKKNKPIAPVTLNGQTVNTATDFVLSGTGWKRGKTEYAGSLTIEFDDFINPYDALKRIASAFGLEIQFRIETDGNMVIGRYVDLIKRVGGWQGKEIESGKDLIGVKRSESTEPVVTALIGLGPERIDGTREYVEVMNEEARQAWGRTDPSTGVKMHLWDIYIPESIDLDMTNERLTTLTENELQKRISSTIQWEIDAANLETIFGLEHEKVSLGDSSRVKATEYNPPVYLDSRIIAKEGPITDLSKKKYILGEFIEYKAADINKVRQDLLKKIAEKVSQEQVFEVTYDKETIDIKDGPGVAAKQKIDTDVGPGTIEDTTGSQLKADGARDEAKTYSEDASNLKRGTTIVGDGVNGPKFSTAEKGARIEFDGSGFRVIDAEENVLVHFPLNGDPNKFSGDLEAAGGTFSGIFRAIKAIIENPDFETVGTTEFLLGTGYLSADGSTYTKDGHLRLTSFNGQMILDWLHENGSAGKLPGVWFAVDDLELGNNFVLHEGNLQSRQPNWKGIPYLNGASDYNTSTYFPGQYRKKLDGDVQLRGMVKGYTIGQALGILPAGSRPGKREMFIGYNAYSNVVRVDVLPSGEIIPVAGDLAWVSLSGIFFAAEN